MADVQSQRSRQGGRFSRQSAPVEPESEFTEEVIHINRVAKVVKGGRKFHFTALVALGDKESRVGLGYGKASEVVDAIKKAVDDARRNMVAIYREGSTIPYEVVTQYCSSKIILKPAAKGHGIIAGGAARPLIALCGIEDVSAKFVGSTNSINTARATFQALKALKSPHYINRLRSGERMDATGRFIADAKKSVAEEAIAEFTAAEKAAPAAANDRQAQHRTAPDEE